MGLKIAIIICSQITENIQLNELTLTQSLAIASLYPCPCLGFGWQSITIVSIDPRIPMTSTFHSQTIRHLLFIGDWCPKGSSMCLNQTQHLNSRGYPKLNFLTL